MLINKSTTKIYSLQQGTLVHALKRHQASSGCDLSSNKMEVQSQFFQSILNYATVVLFVMLEIEEIWRKVANFQSFLKIFPRSMLFNLLENKRNEGK